MDYTNNEWMDYVNKFWSLFYSCCPINYPQITHYRLYCQYLCNSSNNIEPCHQWFALEIL